MDRFRAALTAWAMEGQPSAAAVARELADGLTAVVLVEGASDRVAIEALARRQGRDLAAEGVCIMSIGGAMAVGNYAPLFDTRSGLRLAVHGLCDAAEERYFEGISTAVCVQDLEDELIRALGVEAVERVLADEHDLARFRVFQHQPAQRGRPAERQLRRFFGSISGRKARYARALIDACSLPPPLKSLLNSL
jgi:hypothetical protein